MADDNKAAALPDSIVEAARETKAMKDMITRFRAFGVLVDMVLMEIARTDKVLKEQRKLRQEYEAEMTFLNRHSFKLDAVYRVLAGTYSSPRKAMTVVNDLCRSYPPEYVMEVVRLGSYRLGNPLGMNLLGIKSQSRVDADEHYERSVVPALMEVLPDQRIYLELKQRSIESQHERSVAQVTELTSRRFALEGAAKEYEKEQRIMAASMQPEDIEKLDDEEKGMRIMLLPERQREAELARMREAG